MFTLSNSSHLSDRELMMLHDGELSIRAARHGRKHLENCWSCRYRAEELRATIFSFVEYCDSATVRNTPSQNFTNNFQRRLHQQADQKSDRLKRSLSIFDRFAVFVTPRVLTSLTTIACLLYISFNDQLIPAAKATETLHNAERREMEIVSKFSNSVIHQYLMLSSNGKDLQCELWRTASGTESRSICNGDVQFKTDLSKIFTANSWDSSRPMSPVVFLDWRTRANTSVAEFHRDDARDLITIRYRVLPWIGYSKAGAIREASITLASKTLHPLEQSLRVWTEGGEREIRFREVGYDILAYSRTPFAAASVPAIIPTERKKPASPLPAAVPSVSSDDLENAEAQLRLALHQLHADTEMTPEIMRQGGRIVLRMLVDNEQVQRTMVSVVSAIPLVDAKVWTPENAPPSFRLSTPSAYVEGTGRIYRTNAMRLDELSKCLNSQEAAAEYVEQVQRSIRHVMVPALALRRLSERYSESRYGLVPERSRAALDTVAIDYITSIKERSAQLRGRLVPILKRCGFVGGSETSNVLNQQPARNWRAADAELEAQVRELESAFNQLFTTRESMRAPLSVSEAVEKIAALSNDLSNTDPQAFRENSKAGDSISASVKK